MLFLMLFFSGKASFNFSLYMVIDCYATDCASPGELSFYACHASWDDIPDTEYCRILFLYIIPNFTTNINFCIEKADIVATSFPNNNMGILDREKPSSLLV